MVKEIVNSGKNNESDCFLGTKNCVPVKIDEGV